jgi:hypothetical protein
MADNMSFNVFADPDRPGVPVNPQNATPNDDKSLMAVNVLGPAFDNPTSTVSKPEEEVVRAKFGASAEVTPIRPVEPGEQDDDEDAAIARAIGTSTPVASPDLAEPPANEEAALIGSIKRLAARAKTEPDFANPRLHDLARRESQRDGGARKKVMDALKKAGVK